MCVCVCVCVRFELKFSTGQVAPKPVSPVQNWTPGNPRKRVTIYPSESK